MLYYKYYLLFTIPSLILTYHIPSYYCYTIYSTYSHNTHTHTYTHTHTLTIHTRQLLTYLLTYLLTSFVSYIYIYIRILIYTRHLPHRYIHTNRYRSDTKQTQTNKKKKKIPYHKFIISITYYFTYIPILYPYLQKKKPPAPWRTRTHNLLIRS